jgi:hypothetical protein
VPRVARVPKGRRPARMALGNHADNHPDVNHLNRFTVGDQTRVAILTSVTTPDRDPNAETRYTVLGQQPPNTKAWSAKDLVRPFSHRSMVGIVAGSEPVVWKSLRARSQRSLPEAGFGKPDAMGVGTRTAGISSRRSRSRAASQIRCRDVLIVADFPPAAAATSMRGYRTTQWWRQCR